MFGQLKSDVDRARAKSEVRQMKKFSARALEVKRRKIIAVFETNGHEGLVAYFSRERDQYWMQFIGFDGALYGTPVLLGKGSEAISHMHTAHQGDGWEWQW